MLLLRLLRLLLLLRLLRLLRLLPLKLSQPHHGQLRLRLLLPPLLLLLQMPRAVVDRARQLFVRLDALVLV